MLPKKVLKKVKELLTFRSFSGLLSTWETAETNSFGGRTPYLVVWLRGY